MKKKFSAVDYLECSAKTGEGVEAVFEKAIRHVLLHEAAVRKAERKQNGGRRRFL